MRVCCSCSALTDVYTQKEHGFNMQDDPKNITFQCVVPQPDSVAATVVPPKKPVLPLRAAALPSVADMPFIPPENWTGGLATSILPGICNADLPSDSTRNRYIWVRGAAGPCMCCGRLFFTSTPRSSFCTLHGRWCACLEPATGGQVPGR